jgi:dipeptidase E
MGGGGFLMGGGALDDHILSLTEKPRPRVCFLPTAGGDVPDRIQRFHDALSDRAETSVLPLFVPEVEDVGSFLLEQDVIYVGGGNTANMLAIWRVHAVDRALHAAWRRGIILCGLSAGANCWFQASSTDSFGQRLMPMNDGLGFLAGSFCPHYDGEEQREPSFQEWVKAGALPPGWAADDGVALVFEDTEMIEAVTEVDGGRALRVEPDGQWRVPVRRL